MPAKKSAPDGSRAAYLVGIPGVAALLGLLTFIFLSQRTQLGSARLGGLSWSPPPTSAACSSATCCCPLKSLPS